MSNYAIIIGVNNYTPLEDQGLKTLKGAIPDAEEVYKWITTKGGVPEKNCYLVTSTRNPLKPIREHVDDAIIEIIKSVEQNDDKNADRFYFYFAGHGMGVELDLENNGMCMANWSEYRIDNASLSSKDYKQKFLNEGLFKEIVIWMDCCRNTKYLLKPQGGPALASRGPNINPKWMLAFASQSQNEAFEATVGTDAETETRGIFTKVLLEGLNGGASQNGPSISANDLADYLAYHVPIEAQTAGYEQEPDISGNTNRNKPILFT